jgi:hypothetical protein
MRNRLSLFAAVSVFAVSAALSAASPAKAGDVATRCGQYGCDRIRCDYSGNHCTRFSDYDSYYNGYTNGRYGGYYDDRDRPSDDGGYYGGREYDNGYYGGREYDNGYYGGYGHLVCDNGGSRCYRSDGPYWNYREYYRLHGYTWDTPRY